MARFDNFEPAPLNQSGVGREVRSVTSGIVSGTKSAVGAAFAWTIGVGVLVTAGFIAAPFILSAIGAGAGTLTLWQGISIALGVVAAGLAAAFSAIPAVIGGVWGGAKGYLRERQHAALDQSMYNAVVAEAVARGNAQGQALAYTQQQMPAQATFIQPQPQAQVRQQPEAPAPVELSPAANDNVAPMTGSPAKVAAKDAAYEGTVIASKQLASQL